jgi:hypothetical protein
VTNSQFAKLMKILEKILRELEKREPREPAPAPATET